MYVWNLTHLLKLHFDINFCIEAQHAVDCPGYISANAVVGSLRREDLFVAYARW